MKRLEIQTETTDQHHKQNVKEERISSLKDKVKEIDILTKDDMNYKEILAKNTQEIWDVVKY